MEYKHNFREKVQYKTFENMIYVLKNSIYPQKKLLFFISLYIISTACLEYSVSIISSCILQELECNGSVNRIIGINVVSCFICIIIYSIYVCSKAEMEWRLYYARTKFIEKLMYKVMSMDYEKLESPKVQDLKQKAFNTTSGSNYGMQGMLETTIRNLLHIVKIVVALSLIIVKGKWIIVGVFILTFVRFLNIDKTKQADKRFTWDLMMPIQRKIEYLKNITSDFAYGKDVRLFHMREWLLSKQKKENQKAHKLIVKSQNRWNLCFGVNQIIDFFQNSLLYAWIICSVLKGNMGIAGAVLYLQVVPLFSASLSGMFDDIADARRKALEVNDYRTFVELTGDNETKGRSLKQIGKRYTFTFEDVSFCYAGQEKNALENINLIIEPGEKLAIVGLNGAGKTTLIKLLLRLYEPTKGRILLNGVDIKEFNKQEYYNIFAPMFQDSELYAFSVEENVSMKTESKTDKVYAKDVIKIAGLQEKIDSLPQGMKSQLSKALYDDGIDLSGGERQKLALARALYKKAEVVVLDEPTASLDALAESKLYIQFNKFIGNRTALFISHRLASTKFCDKVIVFKDGKIIERGTHDELLLKAGLYAELFEVQAKYYKESGAI